MRKFERGVLFAAGDVCYNKMTLRNLRGKIVQAERGSIVKKQKLVCAILALCMTVPFLSGCSGAWEGYEIADLSQYITLGDYKGLTYTLTEVKITDEDVEKVIDEVRSENMEKKELTERTAEKNDYVVIDYACKVEAGKISALSGTAQTFVVGSTHTLGDIAGFSDSLIGKKKDDSYVFEFTFPEDYTNDKISDISLVAGKEATIEVSVKSVFEYVLPELDDAFVAKVSKNSATVAEYREEIRTQLTETAREEAEVKMQEEIWLKVVENCTVLKYPQTEIETYRKEMQDYYEEYASYYGYELSEFLSYAYGYTLEEFEKKKQDYAESSVLSDLALYAIARTEGITVSEEEYQQGLKAYFEKTGKANGISTIEEFESYYTKALITQSILWDEVILFLCDTAIGVDAPESGAESSAE